MAPYYTCERHKATSECLACKNEQAYATEEVFRRFSPLPEYRTPDGHPAYGLPPNAYSKCPVCGGDTGACRCVEAGMPPDRLGTSPEPTPSNQTPGNTDYSRGQPLGWDQYFEDRKASKERRNDPVVGNLSDRASNPIAQHAYSGGLLSVIGLGGPCNICGMGRIANCHL